MAEFFVGSGGNDTNNGTTWALRWATIGKALSSGNGMADGDTCWIGPGTYREVKSVTIAPTAATYWKGDVSGHKTDGVGGMIRMTGFTTSDVSASSASTTLNLNGKNYINIQDICVDGGTAIAIDVSTGHDISFTRVHAISQNNSAWVIGTTANVASNITLNGCYGASVGAVYAPTLTKSNGADFDYNIVLNNCMAEALVNGICVNVLATGANAFKGGGVKIYGGVYLGHSNTVIAANDPNLSASVPTVLVYGAVIGHTSATGLVANTSGQITEDFNHILSATARTNVTAGTGSRTTRGSLYLGLDFGRGFMHGFTRPYFAPHPGSPQLFDNDRNDVTTDALGRPRSADALQTVGSHELFDAGYLDSTGDAGYSARIDGPGSFEQFVALNGNATTMTVKCRTDSYTGTNWPQVKIYKDNGDLVDTLSFTSSTNGAFESKTSASFTPTVPSGLDGVMYKIVYISRDGGASGATRFDTASFS